MVLLAKLNEEGGRPAVREYAERLRQELGITPEEHAYTTGHIDGWFAAQEA